MHFSKCCTYGGHDVGGHFVVLVVELLEPEQDGLVTLGGIPTLSPAGSQEGEHDGVKLHYVWNVMKVALFNNNGEVVFFSTSGEIEVFSLYRVKSASWKMGTVNRWIGLLKNSFYTNFNCYFLRYYMETLQKNATIFFHFSW